MILVAGAVLIGVAVPRAQHQGHQMPPAAGDAPAEKIATCSQSSRAVTAALDAAHARVEEARQSNNVAAMRAVVSDLQVAFAQMKMQLADCVALGAPASDPTARTREH
jgi:hypothetical protein